MRDYRDLAIEDSSMENVLLRERIASLEADVAVYRVLLNATFDALREKTVRYQRLEDSVVRVREEYRAFRELMLLKTAADEPDTVTV